MNETALAVKTEQPITPMQLLFNAQQSGATIEQMQQLMDLQERWESSEARKAYHQAIAAFRAEGIKIIKGKHVKFGQTEYNHATLGNVVEKIVPALSRHGLSHSWDMAQEGNKIKVVCRLSHVLGHTETVPMESEPDASGGKNKIQQIASTVTYLQRYTLLAITGLATHDQDDDAKGAEDQYIDAPQIRELKAKIEDTKTSLSDFLKHFSIDTLDDLLIKDYSRALVMLKAKKEKMGVAK